MDDESIARGRLFLVAAADQAPAAAAALALALRLPRCVLVEGSVVDAMVVSGRPSVNAGSLEETERLLLRWSACLAVAETHLLEGYDAVVTDAVTGDHLDDFLDLAAPEPVHLVVLDAPGSSPTPSWGLWLDPRLSPHDLATSALERLDEALVLTAG